MGSKLACVKKSYFDQNYGDMSKLKWATVIGVKVVVLCCPPTYYPYHIFLEFFRECSALGPHNEWIT